MIYNKNYFNRVWQTLLRRSYRYNEDWNNNLKKRVYDLAQQMSCFHEQQDLPAWHYRVSVEMFRKIPKVFRNRHSI